MCDPLFKLLKKDTKIKWTNECQASFDRIKRYCRQHILYPLQLEHLFPNDAEILKPKVGLGPNQMLN